MLARMPITMKMILMGAWGLVLKRVSIFMCAFSPGSCTSFGMSLKNPTTCGRVRESVGAPPPTQGAGVLGPGQE